MRIVTLLASATEIVCELGLREQIVGISHECDFPAEIRGLPVLTEARLDAGAPSGKIDAAVRAAVAAGEGLYRIDGELLRRLRPDVIVTQDQCEVCAVSLAEVERAVCDLLGGAARIVSLNPNRLGDILLDIERVAAATDAVAAGAALLERMRARFDFIRTRAADARVRPRVACLEWLDPPMIAGNWVPEIVEMCGGFCDLAEAGKHSLASTWPQLVEFAPDVVILSPCGFKLEQTRRELPALFARPEWRQLPAVRNRRVYGVDGNAYLNRSGPRIADSAEIVAGLVQPAYFARLLPADAWERVEPPA